MAGEITVNGRKKLTTLQKEFSEAFNYLFIAFIDIADKDKRGQVNQIDCSKSISEARTRVSNEELSLNGRTLVKNIEKYFESELGIYCQMGVHNYQGKTLYIPTDDAFNNSGVTAANKWAAENGCSAIGKINLSGEVVVGDMQTSAVENISKTTIVSSDKNVPKPVKNWSFDNDQVLILAGTRGYKVAEKYGLYRCQNERSFRSSRYMAFYDEGKIEEVFEIMEMPLDNCTPENNEMLKKSQAEYPITELVRFFKLKSVGKVGPVVNDSIGKNGKAVPFTYGQPRYTTLDLIKKAKKTSELIHGLNLDIVADTFVNNKKTISPKVDIIWVVDNSGSMSSHQNNLASNFDRFINNFLNRNLIEIPDFKIAVTTTDDGQNGNIFKNTVLVKNDAIANKSNMIASFKSIVNVGTSGSATERGLKCSRLCAKNNPEFLRDDAMLVIIIITDEEDDDSTEVNFYVSELKTLKSEQRVIINAIAQPTFSRYKRAVDATKGKMVSINSDFSNIMDEISKQIIEVTLNYPLTHTPKNSKNIRVMVNGNENKNYVYQSNENSIKFNEAPQDGATIEIEYEKED